MRSSRKAKYASAARCCNQASSIRIHFPIVTITIVATKASSTIIDRISSVFILSLIHIILALSARPKGDCS